MAAMKIYLDNCCYNRPYDNQNYLPISLETQAKLLVQSLIKAKQLELASSFIRAEGLIPRPSGAK